MRFKRSHLGKCGSRKERSHLGQCVAPVEQKTSTTALDLSAIDELPGLHANWDTDSDEMPGLGGMWDPESEQIVLDFDCLFGSDVDDGADECDGGGGNDTDSDDGIDADCNGGFWSDIPEDNALIMIVRKMIQQLSTERLASLMINWNTMSQLSASCPLGTGSGCSGSGVDKYTVKCLSQPLALDVL